MSPSTPAMVHARLAHRIAEVSYQRNVLECTCGATMPAGDGSAWAAHRKGVGLNVPTIGQSIGKRLRATVVASSTTSEEAAT